jgi:hypothetical protein
MTAIIPSKNHLTERTCEMVDQIPALEGKIKAFVSDDAQTVKLAFETSHGEIQLEMPADRVAYLRDKINEVAVTAEEIRKVSDPFAIGESDLRMMTAKRPKRCGVGQAVGFDGVALTFDGNVGTEAYLVSRAQAEDIARRIGLELAGLGQTPPPRH